jgi:thiamine-phosphate diphosphorylase
VVTDDEVCVRPGFRDSAFGILSTAPVVFHLRAPRASGRWMYDHALALADQARRAGSVMIVNDRLDVALAVADGVQLGARSLSVEHARAIAPREFLVGASVHAAERVPGASWLLAGSIHPTPSHPGRPGAGVGLVSALAAGGATVIAIGGIRPEHVAALRAAGAAGVAVIRGVWDAPDPAAAVRRYLEMWDA